MYSNLSISIPISIPIPIPIEIIAYIASYTINSANIKSLNKNICEEIEKEEGTEYWKQIYKTTLKRLINLPYLEESCNWKNEYLRIQKVGYFDIFEGSDKFIINELDKIKKVAISGKRVKEIPKEVYGLRGIEKLILIRNNLTKIDLGRFTNLKKIFLGDNLINEMPKGINNLINLEKLDLNNNKIEKIFDLNLNNLEELYLEYNLIKKISGVIRCDKLQVLNLNNNYLNEIPNSLNKLVSLVELHMDCNFIDNIPEWIYTNFKKLKWLNLEFTNVSEIPTIYKKSNIIIYL